MAAPPSAPQVVAERFEILYRASSGGMGTVYKATDRISGGTVALKLLRSGGGDTDTARILQEAKMLSELSHPGIVSYVAHGLTSEREPYLAMEWLDGMELASRLQQGPLLVSEVVAILKQVAEALVVAHRRGVIHRDIKPSNLFLRDGRLDQVVLLDFGIARRVLGGPRLTKSGVIVGTLDYMAPEQARGGALIGPPADIFALGCVAYECLLGWNPFAADHPAAVLSKIVFEDPPSLAELVHEVPAELAVLLESMLSKDPLQRPAHATALLDRLSALPLLSQERGLPPSQLTRRRPVSPDREQQFRTILLARRKAERVAANGGRTTEEVAVDQEKKDELIALLSDFGLSAEPLVDGSLVATVSRHYSPTAQVRLCARAALD